MFIELDWDGFIREYNARTGGGLDADRLSAYCNFLVYAHNEARPDEETADRIASLPWVGILYAPRIVCADALCMNPCSSQDYTWEYEGEDVAYLTFCDKGRVFGYKVGTNGGWRFKPEPPKLDDDES